MPKIRKPPPLVNPPSVFDNPIEKKARQLAQMLGLTDSSMDVSDIAPSPMAIMPMKSPARSPAFRRKVLDLMQETADAMGTNVAEAFHYLSQRYPRLMSHHTLGPTYDAALLGKFSPTSRVNLDPALKAARIGRIALNPQHAATRGTDRTVSTLAHEMTHGTQAIRAGDRLRRGVPLGSAAEHRVFGPGESRNMIALERGPYRTGEGQRLRYSSGQRRLTPEMRGAAYESGDEDLRQRLHIDPDVFARQMAAFDKKK